MSSYAIPTIHAAQTALAAYSSYYAYLSITKSMTYEERTEKAAKYSNTAEKHLWKTRKTLGSGTIGLLGSLITSSTLLFTSPSSTKPTKSTIASLTLSLLLALAHSHVSNYWRNSAKIPAPGMKDYNDAISTTAVMRTGLGWLGVSWGVVGVVYLGRWAGVW